MIKRRSPFTAILLTLAFASVLAEQSAAAESEVSFTRIKLYRTIQQQLEAYFDTGDEHLWQAARAMSEAAVENFQDSFYARQCDKYRHWRDQMYQSRSSQKSKFRDLLTHISEESALDLLAGSFGTVADQLLALGDSAASLNSLHYQADLTSRFSGPKYAFPLAQRAIEISRRCGDIDGQARSYNLAGRFLEAGNQLLAAGAYFDSARVLKALLDDRLGVAECLSNMSSVYLSLGERAISQRYLSEALRLRRASGDSIAVAQSLLSLVTVFGRDTDPDSVRAWLREGEHLIAGLDDPVLQVRLQQAHGIEFERRGDFDSALVMYQNAASASEALGEERLLLIALQSSAGILTQIGEFADALRILHEANAIAEKQRIHPARAAILHNLGSAYQQIGDLDAAREYYELSLEQRQKHKLLGNSTGTFLNLAELYLAASDTLGALAAMEQASEEARIAGSDGELSAVWVARARLFSAAGRHDEALKAVDSAKAVYRYEIPRQRRDDLKYLQLDLLRRARRWSQIDSLTDTMRTITREITLTESIKGLIVHGQIALDRGEYHDAGRGFSAAIKFVETLRGELPDIQLRAGFLAQSRFVYELLVHALYRSGGVTDLEATEVVRPGSTTPDIASPTPPQVSLIDSMLCYMERAKSRGLLDALWSGRKTLKSITSSTGSKLIRELDQITQELAMTTDDEVYKRLESRGSEISQELGRLRHEQIARGAAGPRAYQPPPVALDSLRQALPNDRTALLSYLLTPDSSYLVVIARSGARIYTLANRQSITRAVQKYSRLVQTSIKDESLLDSLPPVAREVAQLVFPSSFDPSKYDHLIVSSDGALHFLPFEAVRIGERYLIEHCAITRIPSLFLYRNERIRVGLDSSKRLLAIADPRPKAPMTPLEYSRQEVEWIAAENGVANSTILDSADATRSALRKLNISQFARIHVASHTTIDYDDPARSRIWLSADSSGEYLTTADIESWPLNADLVVLSSCESGGGRFELGEGLDGFARALFSAGARNLVMSLWEVEDFATAGFMRTFYRNLDKGPAHALRVAKLEMIASPRLKHRHPWYWSAFVHSTVGGRLPLPQ